MSFSGASCPHYMAAAGGAAAGRTADRAAWEKLWCGVVCAARQPGPDWQLVQPAPQPTSALHTAATASRTLQTHCSY